jgi:D-3-phosphoglycerate dehydrogenase
LQVRGKRKSMGYTVLLTAPYIIPVFEKYRYLFDRAGIEVIVEDVEERLDEQALRKYAGKIDGTVCGDDKYSEAVLKQFAPRLKAISKWGTGIDSIDKEAAQTLGIGVYNTLNAFTDPVADTVLEYILIFARQGPEMSRRMKMGRWDKLLTRALYECTLGVIGVGNIGKAVLRRAKAFGMTLLGNDIVEIDPAFITEIGFEMISLEDLLVRSDFVSLNCDLNPTSLHLINQERLSFFKSGSVLINTSRGPVVEETALIEALQSGKLAGAALDVFEEEPLPEDSPLLKMENVMLAPHNANSSPAAWEHVHLNTIRNVFIGLGIDFPMDEPV